MKQKADWDLSAQQKPRPLVHLQLSTLGSPFPTFQRAACPSAPNITNSTIWRDRSETETLVRLAFAKSHQRKSSSSKYFIQSMIFKEKPYFKPYVVIC